MQNSLSDITKLAIMNSALSSNLYFFVARSTPWVDDLNPPSTLSTALSDFNDEFIFMKRLDLSGVRFMVDRVDWAIGDKVVGTIVITDDFRIYRCETAGTSTAKPTHVSGSAAATDGGTAVWEFLEEVPLADRTYFLSAYYVPLSMQSERVVYTSAPVRILIKSDIIGPEDGKLPIDREFRVVGLYANPFTRGDRIDTTSFATEVKEYGTVLAFNNISPYARTIDQVDSFLFSVILS